MFGHGIKYRRVYCKKVSFLHPLVPQLLPRGKHYFLTHMCPFGDITYVCVYVNIHTCIHTQKHFMYTDLLLTLILNILVDITKLLHRCHSTNNSGKCLFLHILSTMSLSRLLFLLNLVS